MMGCGKSFVTPAKAGVHKLSKPVIMDSRLHGNDRKVNVLTP
jgi:hypothetical protein